MIIGAIVPEIGDSFREAFFMFWETLWPLVLGFGLSGMAQTFVTRDQMKRNLGNHKPLAIARASGLGMISSSCSYAASAMAKSLFQKGADFITAMVFMFASTNLVIELGIVLAILMGWQFTAAEFIGGPIMIVLLATCGAVVLTPRIVALARKRLDPSRVSDVANAAVDTGHETAMQMSDDTDTDTDTDAAPPNLRSLAAWSDAASFTIGDLKMLRREMAIGYLVAGLLAVFVSPSVWNAVFLHGHGGWTIVENVLVGPVIAFLSFVCSIGNVPLAAALWKGGIRFGGVVSFIFADLIAAPLVLIYRRYYGGQLTLRLVLLFWALMAIAGLLVDALFSASGLIPHSRHTTIAPTAFHWNYTSWLNIVFLVIFGAIYWLYRSRQRLGGGDAYAIDPVCAMQVRKADAPATVRHHLEHYWFCSERCGERFTANPGRFLHGKKPNPEQAMEEPSMAKDPVCGMDVDPGTAAAIRSYKGHNYFFCATGCAEAFDLDQERYLSTPLSMKEM